MADNTVKQAARPIPAAKLTGHQASGYRCVLLDTVAASAAHIFNSAIHPRRKADGAFWPRPVKTLEAFEEEAARFTGSLIPSSGATLVTLSGELGAGKTAFTKVVARTLGVEETVNSPTFVLEKIYLLPRKLGGETSKFARLIHIDAYRLEKGADLAPLGFDELMQDAGNLILLEWPEKVADALPTPSARVSITTLPDGSRTISYAP